MKDIVLEKLGKHVKGFGKLIAVSCSKKAGERECLFSDKGVIGRFPALIIKESLENEQKQ